MDNCPTCNSKIKSGFLGSNNLTVPERVELVNRYSTSPKENYCDNCFPAILGVVIENLMEQIKEHTENIEHCINKIPIITLHNPLNWNYKIVGIITAQTTTGTGVLTELASSVTDALGLQSERTNKKIKTGENLCKLQLRKDAFAMACNAVIGVDIDYAEVGGDKGMLMVCMSGTAVQVANTLDVFSEDSQKSIDKIGPLKTKLKVFRDDLKTIQAMGIMIPNKNPKASTIKGYIPE